MRLFSPKPIFVVTLPGNDWNDQEIITQLKSNLLKVLGGDYHVVVISDKTKTEIETKILK
jgi:hypothetical protein